MNQLRDVGNCFILVGRWSFAAPVSDNNLRPTFHISSKGKEVGCCIILKLSKSSRLHFTSHASVDNLWRANLAIRIWSALNSTF